MKDTIKIPVDPKFQTPPAVCKYMAAMVPDTSITVLEPTPGLGNLVRAIKKRNFEVTVAKDFFLLDKSKRYDSIVMNPPFSSKSAFLKNAPIEIQSSGMKIGYHILTECMKMSDNIIALMPWFTLSDSDVRLRTLKRFGIKSLTALPRKTFEYVRIQTMVIELQKGYKEESVFRAFGIPHENQYEIF